MKKIRYLLMIICIGIFCYSAYQLFNIYNNYQTIKNESEELIDDYIVEEKEVEDPLKRVVHFEQLQKRNKDVIGWLYIPETQIDEPILKGKDNNSYIRTSIDKKKSTAGCIFIDEINGREFEDKNTIIYGHNMKNGSRFHDLRYFVEKEYYDEHQTVYIYLPDNSVNVYSLFSSNIIEADSRLYRKDFEYSSYINEILKTSKQQSIVDKKESPIIMLSTCYTHDSFDRYVVFAKLEKNFKIGI